MLTIELKEANSLKDIYVVIVEADTNDADYISQTTTLNPSEVEEWLPAIHTMAQGKVDGWGEIRRDSYYLTEEFGEEIDDQLSELIPYGEYGGVHSVDLSSFHYYDKDGKVFDVKIKEN